MTIPKFKGWDLEAKRILNVSSIDYEKEMVFYHYFIEGIEMFGSTSMHNENYRWVEIDDNT